MKNLTLEEYLAQSSGLVHDVMASGEIVRVDCGKAGAFVIMEEPEYMIMRDALEAMVRLGVDGKLPDEFQRFLKK